MYFQRHFCVYITFVFLQMFCKTMSVGGGKGGARWLEKAGLQVCTRELLTSTRTPEQSSTRIYQQRNPNVFKESCCSTTKCKILLAIYIYQSLSHNIWRCTSGQIGTLHIVTLNLRGQFCPYCTRSGMKSAFVILQPENMRI